MQIIHFRASAGRTIRRVAQSLGLGLRGPRHTFFGKPEGARIVDGEREILAPPSRPILPHRHPLLETPSIRYPGTWVKGCKGLRVFGPSVSLVDENSLLLADVSVEWGKKPDENWVFRRLALPKAQFLPGRTLVLASTGGDTYFHWMTDVLPRLRLAEKAGYELSCFDRILVNGGEQPFQRESLARWGVPPEKCQKLPAREHAFVLEDAILPSLPGLPGVVPPETTEFLSGHFGESGTKGAKKILIGRAGAKHRFWANEEEVLEHLRPQGFTRIECSRLTLREQAEVFRSAEMVVGAHGAALTNLVFCRPGTRVVELFSPRYVNPCYRDLCAAAGLRHAAVMGDGKDWILSMKHDDPSAAITADWKLLGQALADLEP